MYVLILLQCIQDYSYIHCYFLCTKCQCPFLASYKQSVQVDTSRSSADAESNIYIALLWNVTTRRHSDPVCERLTLKCLSGNKSEFQCRPQGSVSPTVLSPVCICVCVQTRIAAQCLSTISVHTEVDSVLMTFQMWSHWEPLSISQEMSPVLRRRTKTDVRHIHTLVKSTSRAAPSHGRREWNGR